MTDAPADLSPEAALAALLEGNERFRRGEARHPHQDAAHRRSLAGGQQPRVAVLGCSDSRAGVELVCDQGLGDVFVVRTAGHVCERGGSAQASLEFAVAALGVRAVLVLGHTSCGAVAATVADLEGASPLAGAMPTLVELTRGHLDPQDPGRDAVRRHVAGTVRDILDGSDILARAVGSGDLVVAGGVYDLEDGRITLIEETAQDG